MKAVAYYRTRPSEPEASDLALRLQREAVEAGGFDPVAEFIEREGEEGSETYPAYAAAMRATLAAADGEHDDVRDAGLITMVALVIATHAAIGTGEPFQEPEVEVDAGISSRVSVLPTHLQAPTIPAPPRIALPAGAPAPLCLHADYRSRQLDTLVYVCNAGLDALTALLVATDTIDLHQFHVSKPGERWAEMHHTSEQWWDAVLPGTCVWVNSLDHCFGDAVNRYRVSFTDAAGRRWTAKAHDHALSSCHPPESPDQVWTAFGPVRPAEVP